MENPLAEMLRTSRRQGQRLQGHCESDVANDPVSPVSIGMTAGLQQLSIIVPCGPAESAWRELRGDLQALGLADRAVIVACTSADLAALERGWPEARCVLAPPGRAHQLNCGIAASSGRWLWLVHADTRLGADALVALQQVIARDLAALHWFRLGFDSEGGARMRINAFGANVRSRLFGLPFGDQGFLLKRDVFDWVGPFDESLPAAEDHQWLWRARRAAVPLVPAAATLITSARRYQQHGWARTTLRHWRLTVTQALRFRASRS